MSHHHLVKWVFDDHIVFFVLLKYLYLFVLLKYLFQTLESDPSIYFCCELSVAFFKLIMTCLVLLFQQCDYGSGVLVSNVEFWFLLRNTHILLAFLEEFDYLKLYFLILKGHLSISFSMVMILA